MLIFISAGMFGSQSASEFCFTLSNGVVSASSKFDIKYVSFVHYVQHKITIKMENTK